MVPIMKVRVIFRIIRKHSTKLKGLWQIVRCTHGCIVLNPWYSWTFVAPHPFHTLSYAECVKKAPCSSQHVQNPLVFARTSSLPNEVGWWCTIQTHCSSLILYKFSTNAINLHLYTKLIVYLCNIFFSELNKTQVFCIAHTNVDKY